MQASSPSVVIIAGPNGAGKTTAAPFLLKNHLHISEFVNADAIAAGMSAFHPERVAMAAGRVMLERLRELAAERASFAFETTLASRTFAPWIKKLVASGYEFHLNYLWVPSAEVCKMRVARRVMLGGHGVPASDIERRYARSLINLRTLYIPLATAWNVYHSSSQGGLQLVAQAVRGSSPEIADPALWRIISAESNA